MNCRLSWSLLSAMANQRIPLLALVTIAVTAWLLLSTHVHESGWQTRQYVRLSEQLLMSDTKDYVVGDLQPIFKPGVPMPPGYNYSSMLVIARTREENIDWVSEMLPDQPVVAYVVDDGNASLHTSQNKGHEVLVYLTWIIDNYDHLPEVVIFMHAHQQAWHNDDLLDSSNYVTITRLSRPRVWREGFVNMRCNWSPGCPDWIHPGNTVEDPRKEEELVIGKSWAEIFPLEEVPSILAQPCCAQFAVSQNRIQARPYAQYIWFRDWLLNTTLPDSLSGRVWEYVWQFVFAGQHVLCPLESLCLCDQYGLCFGSEERFLDYMALRNQLSDIESNLRQWQEQKSQYEQQQQQWAKKPDERGMFRDHVGAKIEPPDLGKGERLRKDVDRLRLMVNNKAADAEERGKDPKHRAFEAGREWHEGDGF